MTLAWTPSQSGTRVRRPGRVLVVGDDATLARALQRGLSDENQVVVVGEAAEALALLDGGESYDIVLCELMLPAMDGIDLHRRAQARHPEAAARMVFMTGEATTARVDAFFRRVPNLLLEKPVSIDGIHALIERRVGRFASAA
jgi:CheY-like chemotaxis protein